MSAFRDVLAQAAQRAFVTQTGGTEAKKSDFRLIMHRLFDSDPESADAVFSLLDADRRGRVDAQRLGESGMLLVFEAWRKADPHHRGYLTRAGLDGGERRGFRLFVAELGADLPAQDLQDLYSVLDRRRAERVALKEVLEREFPALLRAYLEVRGAPREDLDLALPRAGVYSTVDIWDAQRGQLDIAAFGRQWLLSRTSAQYYSGTEKGQREAGMTDMTLRRRGSGASYADSAAPDLAVAATTAVTVGRACFAFKKQLAGSGTATPSTETGSRASSRSPEPAPRSVS